MVLSNGTLRKHPVNTAPPVSSRQSMDTALLSAPQILTVSGFTQRARKTLVERTTNGREVIATKTCALIFPSPVAETDSQAAIHSLVRC
jgi:hypothetical protein